MHSSHVKTVRNDVKGLVREAQDLFREATSITGDKAEDLRTKGINLLETALASAHDAQVAVIDTSKEAFEATDDFVKDNPWKAVAISAGVGLLVGVAARVDRVTFADRETAVAGSALFWHMCDVAWFFLFPLFFAR